VLPYPAAGGRRLKPDTLYRSGELSRLDEYDRKILLSLGIKLVCDLRSTSEQAEYVSRWPDGSTHVHLDLPERDQSNAGPEKIFGLIGSLPGNLGGLKAMDQLYRRKPRAFAGNLRRLFDAILCGDSLPLLIHCHAGKDRTGFMVAMLLTAAGVSRADIIEDYVATARFFPVEVETHALVGWAKRSFGHDIAPVAAAPLAEARPEFIAAAFTEIETGWGSADAYLEQQVGLTPAARDAFRDMLLA
jgi:protein-tyrosine phosphatase